MHLARGSVIRLEFTLFVFLDTLYALALLINILPRQTNKATINKITAN